jgi:hypothetical protein
MKLDALLVAQAGTEKFGQKGFLYGFFVKVPNNESATLSFMRDRENKRNYLMVVNNDYKKAQDIALVFDSKIGSIELGKFDAEAQKVEWAPGKLANGNLVCSLGPGEAAFYRLPADFDYGGFWE